MHETARIVALSALVCAAAVATWIDPWHEYRVRSAGSLALVALALVLASTCVASLVLWMLFDEEDGLFGDRWPPFHEDEPVDDTDESLRVGFIHFSTTSRSGKGVTTGFAAARAKCAALAATPIERAPTTRTEAHRLADVLMTNTACFADIANIVVRADERYLDRILYLLERRFPAGAYTLHMLDSHTTRTVRMSVSSRK